MHPQLICYPLPSALSDGKENPPLSRNSAPTSKWNFLSRESGSFFLLQRVSCEGRGLTPLYILQVSLAGPRTTVEAQAFYRMYHSYADIPNPWDRLRWCRYGLDLLQKEVAAMVGMEEWLYRDLESGAFHRSFTPELADKLAALYGIPVRIFWTTTPCFCTGAEEPSSADTGRQKAGTVSSLPTTQRSAGQVFAAGKTDKRPSVRSAFAIWWKTLVPIFHLCFACEVW